MRYRSSLIYAVPFSIPAGLFAVAGLALAGMSLFQPKAALLEGIALIVVGLFCLACAAALLKIAFGGIYFGIEVDDSGLSFHKLRGRQQLGWGDIKYLARSQSTLTLTTTANEPIEVSANLEGFEDFCRDVTERFERHKGRR